MNRLISTALVILLIIGVLGGVAALIIRELGLPELAQKAYKQGSTPNISGVSNLASATPTPDTQATPTPTPLPNLTALYNSQVPKEKQTHQTLVDFIVAQPIITTIPTVNTSLLNIVDRPTDQVVSAYADVAFNFLPLHNPKLIAEALRQLDENSNITYIKNVNYEKAQEYQQKLSSLVVPMQALELQKILLGYSELLLETYDQILFWNEDLVRAQVGIRQLRTNEEQYIPLIENEINILKNKNVNQQ